MMKKSNKKGFTLVELIVVIAIMAILAAVLVPTVTSKIGDANQSSADSSANAVANNVQSEIISIHSGLTNDTKYVEKDGESVKIKTGYSNKEGNATIALVDYGTGNAYIKVTATVSNKTGTYYVAKADGKVTNQDPGAGTEVTP